MKKILPLVLLFISVSVFGQDEAAIAAKADSLHKVFFTIDTHNDYAIFACHPDYDDYSVEKGQVSFPMMVEGGLDASVFAIYMGQAGRSEDSLKLAVEYGVREVKLFKEFVEKNFSDYVEIAYSADDLLRIKAAGKRAVLLSLENGYMLGKDIKNVEMFYNLGIRLITLCHFGDNDVCDSANGSKDEWGGLSPFGVEVVKEMNRLGMIIDLSHSSEGVFYDVAKHSKQPFIASHSCARALCNHRRNLDDAQLKMLGEKGGVVGLNFYNCFLNNAFVILGEFIVVAVVVAVIQKLFGLGILGEFLKNVHVCPPEIYILMFFSSTKQTAADAHQRRAACDCHVVAVRHTHRHNHGYIYIM
jgi:microsomal dipeptidase-like Zn-dependent dipeptidase